MLCIFCSSDTSVTNSRPSKKSSSVWRRRACDHCDLIFSTKERPDLTLSIKVTGPSTNPEPLQEDKLFVSLLSSFSHRNDALRSSRQLTETILGLLLPVRSGELEKTKIAAETYKVLRRFDKAAAVYYKAHHQIK